LANEDVPRAQENQKGSSLAAVGAFLGGVAALLAVGITIYQLQKPETVWSLVPSECKHLPDTEIRAAVTGSSGQLQLVVNGGPGTASVYCPVTGISNSSANVDLSVSGGTVNWGNDSGSGAGATVKVTSATDAEAASQEILQSVTVVSKPRGEPAADVPAGVLLRQLDPSTIGGLIVTCRSAWRDATVVCRFKGLALVESS